METAAIFDEIQYDKAKSVPVIQCIACLSVQSVPPEKLEPFITRRALGNKMNTLPILARETRQPI